MEDHFPMRRYHRHRPVYYDGRQRSEHRTFSSLLGLALTAALVLATGWWLLKTFGFGGSVQRAAVQMLPEDRAVVRVSVNGGEWNRTGQELKLYAGDRIATDAGSHAVLRCFDGTMARLDGGTSVTVLTSQSGEKNAEIALQIDAGTIWIETASQPAEAEDIDRFIHTALLLIRLPDGTEAIVSDHTLNIFDSVEIGAEVTAAGNKQTAIVGEGQSFVLPAGSVPTGDLYAFRSALDLQAPPATFLQESRDQARTLVAQVQEASGGQTAPVDILMVTEPAQGAAVRSSTINVRGRIDLARVALVRVNGYEAAIDKMTGAFSLELTLPDDNESTVTIEAVDAAGQVLADAVRTIAREVHPPSQPHFLQPASDGQVYQTQRERIEIVGSAPPEAIGIVVNDYRLRFFEPGDEEWTYLASMELQNLAAGENVFTAVAIDAEGLKSEPVTMTIVLGGATEGVVGGGEDVGNEGTEQLDPATLPTNDPLQPGTITVTAPSAGEEHVATTPEESELLIEGAVPQGTYSVWVNNYRLQLFKPGKTYWNYIASMELGTMHRGRNAYEIVARDAEGQILDRLTYVIRFTPRS